MLIKVEKVEILNHIQILNMCSLTLDYKTPFCVQHLTCSHDSKAKCPRPQRHCNTWSATLKKSVNSREPNSPAASVHWVILCLISLAPRRILIDDLCWSVCRDHTRSQTHTQSAPFTPNGHKSCKLQQKGTWQFKSVLLIDWRRSKQWN